MSQQMTWTQIRSNACFMLLEFEGTLIVVSHDRTFLNNIVTSTLALIRMVKFDPIPVDTTIGLTSGHRRPRVATPASVQTDLHASNRRIENQ